MSETLKNSFGSFGNHANGSSENIKIEIGDKTYNFSQEMVNKYPKLLDPSAKYTLGFETVLPIIWEYDPSVLRNDLLDENSEKTLFLANCEFFGIKLSDAMILHLSSNLKKDIQECSDFIQRETGKKGKTKMRYINNKAVVEWCSDQEKAFIDSGSDIKPLDIIKLLEVGNKALDQLVLHDFKSKNLVMPLIKKFLQFFLPDSV